MSDASEDGSSAEYDVVVVGGGPAGMSAALYTTRLGHSTAVVGRGGGRAAMTQNVHSLLGVPEETSGGEFLGIGREQLEAHGCEVHRDAVSSCSRDEDGRVSLSSDGGEYASTSSSSRRVLPTCDRSRRSREPGAASTTVCTATRTCSSTGRSTSWVTPRAPPTSRRSC